MEREFPMGSVAKGAAIGGPIFTAAFLLLSAMQQLPDPLDINFQSVGAILMLIVAAAIFGFVIAFVPAVIATMLLGTLGKSMPLFRPLSVWLAVGAAVVGIPAAYWHFPLEMTLALVAAAMTTAACCHHGFAWD